MKSKILVACVAFSMLSGCASITKDSHQVVKVETYNENDEKVEDVKCVAKNAKGEWHGTVPGSMTVHRSDDNLELKCEKEGEEAGFASLISRANGSMFGNILFGGGIGAIMDHANGKAYDYPDWVRVIIGQHLLFDRKNNKENEVMLGKVATKEEVDEILKQKKAEEAEALEQAKAEQAAKE